MLTVKPIWRGIALLLGAFAGLCTLFAALATGFDAWREHVQAGWPTAQASVERCEVREYAGRARSYYINCRISYSVVDQSIKSHVASRTVPDPARVLWQSAGAPTLGDFQAWVDAHPTGATIEVHYDPAVPKTAALVVTDMPLGGPRTPSNLRVLRLFAIMCVTLLLIGGAMRPRASPISRATV